MKSAYIHIPFCKSICSYCDFCKVLYHGPWIVRYLNALAKEIKDSYHDEILDTIYIGGGTPSSLDIKDLNYLLDICSIFKVSDDLEFSIECNLNDINEEMLLVLKDHGVNRLSIGIESFDKNKLKFMERSHSYKEAQEKIKMARRMGFNNINLDLIYGIPNESLHTLKSDIKKILSLKPEHISTYSLIIEDNTKIGINHMVPIEEDMDFAMYDMICKLLKKNGYVHYEVSNFCKDGFASRHNSNYWLNNEYYGFGCGASGYVGNIRYDNTKSINKYMDNKFRFKENVLSRSEDMDNYIMLGFRLLKGINLNDFYERYNVNLQEVYDVSELLNNKELLYKDGYIYINPKYIYTMNEILIKII